VAYIGEVAVSEEDDAHYRRRISEVLNRHGFGWVVAQAEAQIACCCFRPVAMKANNSVGDLRRMAIHIQ
jgi:hypothetical protein